MKDSQQVKNPTTKIPAINHLILLIFSVVVSVEMKKRMKNQWMVLDLGRIWEHWFPLTKTQNQPVQLSVTQPNAAAMRNILPINPVMYSGKATQPWHKVKDRGKDVILLNLSRMLEANVLHSLSSSPFYYRNQHHYTMQRACISCHCVFTPRTVIFTHWEEFVDISRTFCLC